MSQTDHLSVLPERLFLDNSTTDTDLHASWRVRFGTSSTHPFSGRLLTPIRPLLPQTGQLRCAFTSTVSYFPCSEALHPSSTAGPHCGSEYHEGIIATTGFIPAPPLGLIAGSPTRTTARPYSPASSQLHHWASLRVRLRDREAVVGLGFIPAPPLGLIAAQVRSGMLPRPARFIPASPLGLIAGGSTVSTASPWRTASSQLHLGLIAGRSSWGASWPSACFTPASPLGLIAGCRRRWTTAGTSASSQLHDWASLRVV